MTEVVVVREPVITVHVAQPGLPGPPGPPGAVTLSGVAGAAGVSGHRVVIATAAGLQHADTGNPQHADAVIGLTLNAAAPGGAVTLQTVGDVTESSWAWTPGEPLFVVGSDGLLSHTPPASGWVQVFAVAVSATRILLTPRQAVLLN